MTNDSNPRVKNYYPELDGVRALAALMVIFFHMGQMGIRIPGPSSFGETGVDLFFVLSGFLITGILLRSPARDWGEVRNFYVRRSLRIFPLYYCYLALASLLGTTVAWWYWGYLQNIPIALGAPMGNIGHFWSLAVEEQFYLVWPFLVLFLPRRYLQPALWSMLAGTILCRIVLVRLGHVEVYYLTLTRLDGLAAGALLALHHSRGTLARARPLLLGLGVTSLVLVAWQGLRFHGAGLPVVQVTKFSLFACFYGSAVGLLLTAQRNVVTVLLASPPMRWLGRISYGLYVFHPQVLRLTFAYLAHLPMLVRAVAGLAATLAVTLASWHGFERPFLKLKDRLADSSSPKAAAKPMVFAAEEATGG